MANLTQPAIIIPIADVNQTPSGVASRVRYTGTLGSGNIVIALDPPNDPYFTSSAIWSGLLSAVETYIAGLGTSMTTSSNDITVS